MNWIPATIQVPDKPVLTLSEVSVAVGYHEKTIKRWVKEGTFPASVRIGDGNRWTALSVGVWLAWQNFARQPVAGDEGDETEDAVKRKT